MRYIFLGVGSILAILFMVQIKKGKRFASIVEGLDSSTFPLNQLYVVGLAWSSTKLFKLRSKRAADLRAQATLLLHIKR